MSEAFQVGIGNTIFLVGEIAFGDSLSALIEQTAGRYDLELVINSEGGDAITALAFHKEFAGRISKATIVKRCFSAAVICACAAKTVEIMPDARMMIHTPNLAIIGNRSQLEDAAIQLSVYEDRFIEILVGRGIPREIASGLIHDGKDHFFTPAAAWELKLVDEILDASEVTPEAAEADTAGPVRPDDGKGQLLLELLENLGEIQSANPEQLARSIHYLLRRNLKF